MKFGKAHLKHSRLAIAASLAVAAAGLAGAAPASAFSLKVNFQPAGAAKVTGYASDTGLGYDDTRGYGWVTQASVAGTGAHVPLDATDRTRERHIASDQRLDTLIHVDDINKKGTGPGAWEAKVPNGSYTVTVAAGDPAAVYDSVHRVNIERTTTAINYTPTSAVRSMTATRTVTVSDGRLTLDAIGGTNTKFQYVTIDTSTVASATVDVKINFCGNGTATIQSACAVSGYTTDAGAAYAAHGAAGTWGWVAKGSSTGLNQTAYSRRRGKVSDARVDSFVHMQYPGKPEASWELAVPDGTYDVVLGVGDPSAWVDSQHSINVEGKNVLEQFQGVDNSRFRTESTSVAVSDGRLTIDPGDGVNTKLDWITVTSASSGTRPTVGDIQPADGAVNVTRGRGVTAEVHLPVVGAGVDPATLTASTVRLERIVDGTTVPSIVGTTGGHDAINLTPKVVLDKNTEYRFVVTSGAKTTDGASFVPASSTFTTNSGDPGTSTVAKFNRVEQVSARGLLASSLTVGPDNRLYVATLTGKIMRYDIANDGSLTNAFTINTVVANNGGEPKNIIGLAFDPASTAAAPILWVSYGPLIGDAATPAPDWSGTIARLSGANLATFRDVVVNLPRSVQDHETNSLAFGPDGALYVTQGSNTGTGSPDNPWGNRNEHLLNAAVLRIDTAAIPGTLDVKTEDRGALNYDPFAPTAPVTLYATGLRNAYDLVWHSNGQLYTAVNGSGGYGNAPAQPAGTCSPRIDSAAGPFDPPAVPGVTSMPAEPDVLERVTKGKYYGHPNPSRCEFIFFGGHPDATLGPFDTAKYPQGTQPDRNYVEPAWNFGLHFSPDGMIEYKGNAFNGALDGRLLVARYSQGKDIVAMKVNPTTKGIDDQEDGIPGLGGFVSPLDIAEDNRNGNLYVTDLGTEVTGDDSVKSTIYLLKPDESITPSGTPTPGPTPTPTPTPSPTPTGTPIPSPTPSPSPSPTPAPTATPAPTPFPTLTPTIPAGGRLQVTNDDELPSNDRMVFSRIASLSSPPPNIVHDRGTLTLTNTGGGTLKITSWPISGTGAAVFQLVSPPALPLTLAPGASQKLTVRFVATSHYTTTAGNRVWNATLGIKTDSLLTPTSNVALAGRWQYASELGSEPTLGEIVNQLFGYKTVIGNFNHFGHVQATGDEVVSQWWRRADPSQPVKVSEIAAMHTYGLATSNAYFGFYLRGAKRGSSNISTITHIKLRHDENDAQSLLPHKDNQPDQLANTTFNPPAQFAINSDGESSDWTVNDVTADHNNGCVDPCGFKTRFWPLKTSAGALVPNTYIVTMDYHNVAGANYDYQDNVYVVTNLAPVTEDATEKVLYRIDVGSTVATTDSRGRTWAPDTGLYSSPAGTTAIAEGKAPFTIADTDDDTMYGTYRGNVGTSTPLANRSLDFNFPTTATKVNVRLYFDERAWTSTGQRLFDVYANGEKRLSNFDIFANSEGKDRAWSQELDGIGITGGKLNLHFQTIKDFPAISGIEVICAAGCS